MFLFHFITVRLRMQTQSRMPCECKRTTLLSPSVGLSVCLSVRPYVKRVHCDRTKETFVHIFTPCERSIILVSDKKNGCWGDDSLYLKFCAKLTPFLQNADFHTIFAHSASAVRPSEKKFNYH